jgi:hypothetical protein
MMSATAKMAIVKTTPMIFRRIMMQLFFSLYEK